MCCCLSLIVTSAQDQLAHVLYKMTVFRDHCLSLPRGSHKAVTNVQQISECLVD
jgi:hypothetical protein